MGDPSEHRQTYPRAEIRVLVLRRIAVIRNPKRHETLNNTRRDVTRV